MHVKCLDYIVYSSSGGSWKCHKIPNPSWAEIEQALRRLNCFEYPHVFLWANEDPSKHNYDEGELFEVMGGKGVFWLAGTFDGYSLRRLDYPERGEGEVAIWTSDQGFADAERHVCRDLEAVIRAARYYCYHRGFDPELRWGTSL